MLLVPFVFLGCAATLERTSRVAGYNSLISISDGLPADGLWRENIALYDIDGDGFLDIVAPPPRKAENGRKRPFIFLWNAVEKRWTEGKYTFPDAYAYGGIAVGDLNNDGHPDIVLAQHGGKITILLNDNKNGFFESPLPLTKEFHSRGIVLSDVNGDGLLDIIAVSEARFSGNYAPAGILVAINKGGKDWDVRALEESSGLFGDSVAVGDIRGSGNKDVAVAFTTAIKEMQKLVWFGDGKGDFNAYAGDLFGEGTIPVIVRTGNVDGDGEDEVAFGLALVGSGTKIKGRLSVMKWSGEGFSDISAGLDIDGYLVAFDLADIDGDGRSELVVLTETGIYIYKYDDTATWHEVGHFSVPAADVSNVTDLKAGRNKDGSVVIVYNLGKYETSGLNQGIKAYILK